MTIHLIMHLEAFEIDGLREVAWWAESPDVPGFSAAAPTVVRLRSSALEALVDHLGYRPDVVESLACDGSSVATADVVVPANPIRQPELSNVVTNLFALAS